MNASKRTANSFNAPRRDRFPPGCRTSSNEMTETYKAIEVRKPGEFAEVRRPLQDPSHDQVRIRVEACGVCHSDAATVEGGFPGITYPRVPGHEVVGRIDAVGSGVRGWQVGQRVGVGFLAGSCWLLRILPRRRPCELSEPGKHGNSSRRRLCRSFARQGERSHVDPRRSVLRQEEQTRYE